MASGKAKRQRDEVEVEDLPATKRHAAADGPLKGLQQIPLFGAFYPPAGNDSHTPHSKDRKRQVYANGRRAVLPKLPCPLLPAHGTAASWEAPEVEDSKETSGSNTLAFAAPAPLTLQQIEAPAANLPVASPDKPHLPEAKSTKDPQLLAAFPQFNHANGNTPSQRAEAQERERGALSQGAQAFSMSGVSESAAKGSIQPQAAPQQATFGQQLISGNLAAPPSTQQGQVSALQPPSNASAADAGGGAGVPAQSTVMPFQPVQPCAVPGQQSGLFLGQPVQQQGGGMASGEGPPQPQRAVRRVKRGIRR